MPPPAYLVHAASRRRPSVWLEAQAPGYFSERFDTHDFCSAWPPAIREIRGLSYAVPDAVLWTGPGPLISSRAVDFLRKVAPGCANYVFFTSIKGKDFYVVDVLDGADALDDSRSDVSRSPSGGLMNINRHAFAKSAPIPALFKLRGRLDGDLYCSPSTAVAIYDSGLRGFSFWNPLVSHIRDLFLGKDVSCVPMLGA